MMWVDLMGSCVFFTVVFVGGLLLQGGVEDGKRVVMWFCTREWLINGLDGWERGG